MKTDYSHSVSQYTGKSDVLFLPYLMGERSPVNDTSVRGMFCGLSMNISREEMLLAVLEGAAFSIKQNIEIIKSLGVDIHKSKICGGVLGACILAAKGCGNDIAGNFYGVKCTVSPEKDLAGYYNNKYSKYLMLYPMARNLA